MREYVCRLLGHMRSHGYDVVHAARAGPLTAHRSPSSTSHSGYVQRSVDSFPARAR